MFFVLLTIRLNAIHMKTSSLSILFLGLLVFASPLQAKKKKHSGSEPSPTPASAPAANPNDLPSKTLQPFLDAQLGTILSPLDRPGFDRPEILASLKAGYADGMAAAPATRKPAFQTAQSVCDAMASAIAERQSAVSALKGATATHNSEAENQPRGGRKAVKYEQKHTDNFFTNTQNDAWTKRAATLRQNVMNVYLRERELERQALVAEAPTPAAGTANATAAPAAATTSSKVSTDASKDDSAGSR